MFIVSQLIVNSLSSSATAGASGTLWPVTHAQVVVAHKLLTLLLLGCDGSTVVNGLRIGSGLSAHGSVVVGLAEALASSHVYWLASVTTIFLEGNRVNIQISSRGVRSLHLVAKCGIEVSLRIIVLVSIISHRPLLLLVTCEDLVVQLLDQEGFESGELLNSFFGWVFGAWHTEFKCRIN